MASAPSLDVTRLRPECGGGEARWLAYSAARFKAGGCDPTVHALTVDEKPGKTAKARGTAEREMAVSAEQVFATLEDGPSWSKWVPLIREVAWTSSQPFGERGDANRKALRRYHVRRGVLGVGDQPPHEFFGHRRERSRGECAHRSL